MTTYIARRLLIVIPTLLGVLLVVFFMVRLAPGDPAVLLAGEFATPETLADIRERFGLDQPLHVQLGLYMASIFQGDLGESVRTRQPVTEMLADFLPNTIQLALGAMLVALLIGIPAGIIAAIRPGTPIDLLVMLGALIGISMPTFWFGLMAILIFSVYLGWFPVAGTGTIWHLVLPAITLGTGIASVLARMTRSAMLEVLSQDYIRTARAKGVAGRVVVFKHALRNALIPVVTITGLLFGGLLEGAVIVETVFAWPGIGQLVVSSILARDYPVVQGAVLLIAVVFILINLLVDLLYGVIDPRIRYD
jgi:peptide/nickel transport system permease protein/oligopeptide transport system permease protein